MEPEERQAEIERMKSSFVPFRPVEDLDLILFGEPKEKTVPRYGTRKISFFKIKSSFYLNFFLFSLPLTQNDESRMEVDDATSSEISQNPNDIEI